VFSVTSETAANVSLQNAPSRSAKADQSPAPDSFSALIDSNDTAGNDRIAPAAPDRPSPQARPDAPSTDSRQRPDTASPSSAAAKTPSQDAEPNAAQPVAAGSSSDVASKPAKPGPAKSGIVKTAVKDAASDLVSATDGATSADPAASQPAAATTGAPAPVAAVIAVPVAATDIIIAPASPGNATEPLAIAAAAIATSTSTVEATKPVTAAAQGPGDQAKPAAAPATPVTTPAEAATIAATPVGATTDAVVPAAAAAIDVPAPVDDPVAIPANQPAAKADAATQATPELTAAVAAATPVAAVAPKTAPKTPARSSESAAPIKTGIAPSAADLSAPSPSSDAAGKNVAPQGPVADGKPKTDGGAVDAAKAEPANADAPAIAAATAAPHGHRVTAAAPVQIDTSDAGQAANAVQQPQASSTTTPVATQLTVTAATTAGVPLNGLALQIAVTAQSGKSRFEIRLDPAELGRIDVRIDVDRHGQVTSHLTVEKPETLAMLRQDAPQLQRALDNAGFKTGDSGLQFSLRDQSSSGQNTGDEAGRNAQRLIISEDDTVPAAVAGRTYGRMLGSSSGVDIRV
jgi:flagellar hook-length control protein FliK